MGGVDKANIIQVRVDPLLWAALTIGIGISKGKVAVGEGNKDLSGGRHDQLHHTEDLRVL